MADPAPKPEVDEDAAVSDTGSDRLPDFYCRYYVGHSGRFGHEFLEFELRDDGTVRYANNSNYKRDSLIKKEVCVAPAVLEELKRVIRNSKILECDDTKWPTPDRGGRQELEILVDQQHISFSTNKCSLMSEILASEDAQGLSTFFYVAQDLKQLVLSLIAMHHRVKPV
jgi:protein mago nashi